MGTLGPSSRAATSCSRRTDGRADGRGGASIGGMLKHTLAVEQVLSIPIREVSGLCIHRPSGGAPRLVAIGDATLELAWAVLVPGQEPRWEVADLTALGIDDAGRGSQFEAIATDAEGLVLILREYPAVVHVIDPRRRRVVTTIELVIRDGDSLRPPRARSAASLGEAMLPLQDGRLLVSKEKVTPAALRVRVARRESERHRQRPAARLRQRLGGPGGPRVAPGGVGALAPGPSLRATLP